MSEAVIAGYVRSPFTPARKGALAKVRPDELMAQVVRGLLERNSIDLVELEDMIIGCAFPEGEQGLNVARIVGFLADLPVSVAGTTVNRFCGSSMQAIHMAAGAIATNAGEAFICGGVESMTRVPMMGFNPLPHPGLCERAPEVFISMGITAENLARKHEITREAQEAFALESQQRTLRAANEGYFDDEIVTIENGGKVSTDGCPRPDTNLEALAALKPAFDANGSVTAGTSSPLTDGASAVLLTSADYAQRNGLKTLARIRATAVSGCAPEIMGIGPVEAARKALDRAELKLEQMDIIELNEAFAAQSLAVLSELGLSHEKVNLDGGAIALGHPLGASGARITGKAASLLQREGGKYALATMCIGGGQGIATVLEAT
ncbi:MAG: thiolase family protein [Candidatus Poseidoniia archaeon]|jgi:acetyl-CoA acyltransferase|nr:thiolase family protein [Candidatus Poseidoniia archaeon]MDP6489773.1 thiolase family protein [Candidatus Poseidoniia archaeon]MDP6534289.1 thiolase family protein [Candidatus Poseidoniia archaeon]MDP6834603.1 thiolase family protein [Candidatus Poseidoniia archaeon]MDP7081759.1 thiolase family protein [Candidatus Poseidoniia archaeon]|tara:strand:- start:418 stop:1551 length:1134 start_codon:yes stop_codon:yes gene_type:complete